MFELDFFDKETEELLEEHVLTALTSEDVYQIFGFYLEGDCADVSPKQLEQIEQITGKSFTSNGRDIYLCEVQD
ncbi:DUF7683 domain-containing protein [Enterovibrio norvegicus]|uniref:DUF7683 domain-containing protein n=1 Tax=Enterovibrio norvegicus TaxID=188144 RepID=UPI00352E5CDC